MDVRSPFATAPLIELWASIRGTWHLHEIFDSSAREFAAFRDPAAVAGRAAWCIGLQLRRTSLAIAVFELRHTSMPTRPTRSIAGVTEGSTRQPKQALLPAREVAELVGCRRAPKYGHPTFTRAGRTYQVVGSRIIRQRYFAVCEEVQDQRTDRRDGPETA